MRPQPKKSLPKKSSPPRAYDEDDVEVLEIPKIEAKKTVIDLSSDSEEDTLRSLKTVTPSPPMGVNSPPAVKQSADFVRSFRLAKVKIEKEACQTPISDISQKGQQCRTSWKLSYATRNSRFSGWGYKSIE